MCKEKTKSKMIIPQINGFVADPIRIKIGNLNSKNPADWFKQKEKSWLDLFILK